MKKYCGTSGGNWCTGHCFFWEAVQGQGRLSGDLGHKNFQELSFCWYSFFKLAAQASPVFSLVVSCNSSFFGNDPFSVTSRWRLCNLFDCKSKQ